jgi:hypothetical protein
MSAPTLKPPKPHGRLQRLVTLDRLATAATWVFWLFAVGTALQVLVAVTRGGVLFAPTQDFPPGPLLRVWVPIGPPLLLHSGSVLIHSGLAHGVQASWNGAIVGTAHPTAGQALAFAVTLLPASLLRVGTLYLVMRLARAAARDSVYTVAAARLVLFLGWWLLAGGLVAGLAGAFARLNLLSLLVTWHVDWVRWPASWSEWGTVEFFGLGLIIFARIMRVSARMRADLEGTV